MRMPHRWMNVPLTALILILMPDVGLASGVNLRWANCFGEGTGLANKVFNCGLCSGTNVVVASFIPPTPVPEASALTLTVSIVSSTPVLPAWWDFVAVTGCRANSLSANSTANANDVVCIDWSQGQLVSLTRTYNTNIAGPNTARATLASIASEGVSFPLQQSSEYFALNATINNAKTNGTGACAGCNVGVCLFLNSIRITQANGQPPVLISGASNGTDSDLVTWQGTSNAQFCVGATPVKRSTWSAIKAFYRGP